MPATSINLPLSVLLRRLNPALRGWCAYFRPGVSSATFSYLAAITWRQVMAWLRRKHRRITWKALRRRYCGGGWQPADGNTRLLHTGTISTPGTGIAEQPSQPPGSLRNEDTHEPRGTCGEPGAR